MRLTIAGLQHPGHPGDVDANLAVVAEAAHEARARGADLLVTPEMFVTGYNIGDRVARLAGRPLVAAVASVAAEAGIAIVAGLPERHEDGSVANTALLVDETGAAWAGEVRAAVTTLDPSRRAIPGDYQAITAGGEQRYSDPDSTTVLRQTVGDSIAWGDR